LQCYEGKPLFEIDRARMLRSGLVGFTLHGSLSHYYYQFCEVLLFLNVSYFLDCGIMGFNCSGLSNTLWIVLGTVSFRRLVGGSCQGCLWSNCLVSNLEQHLLHSFGNFTFWIPSCHFQWIEGYVLANVDCKKTFCSYLLLQLQYHLYIIELISHQAVVLNIIVSWFSYLLVSIKIFYTISTDML